MKKIISGFTSKTSEHLLLDSGAFFKNYNIGTDTFESAVTAGKLIGATRNGGKFDAIPEIRHIDVDGVKGPAKGLEMLDAWNVTIGANVLEITTDTLALALAGANVDSTTNEKYDIVTGKNTIELDDYIENITWVGTISGSEEPVIIQVMNALNTGGLSLQTQMKNEAVTALNFLGHYTPEDLNTPPFVIYYPKLA